MAKPKPAAPPEVAPVELTSAEAGQVLSVVTGRMLGQAAAPTQGLRRTLLARLAALVRSGRGRCPGLVACCTCAPPCGLLPGVPALCHASALTGWWLGELWRGGVVPGQCLR